MNILIGQCLRAQKLSKSYTLGGTTIQIGWIQATSLTLRTKYKIKNEEIHFLNFVLPEETALLPFWPINSGLETSDIPTKHKFRVVRMM